MIGISVTACCGCTFVLVTVPLPWNSTKTLSSRGVTSRPCRMYWVASVARWSRLVSSWLRIWFRTVTQAAIEASATLSPTATITRAVMRVRSGTCDISHGDLGAQPVVGSGTLVGLQVLGSDWGLNRDERGHGAVSRREYPTPRTVWIRRGRSSASVLRRR